MIDILLTNDDGYQAIGFYPLLKELSKKFNVVAVVPDSKMSWKGKSITYNKDIIVEKKQLEEFEVYAVSGTPADCVQIGLYDLLSTRPKFVVSGINIGSNAGHGRVLSSGTAGAGMEAAIDGVKALASSLDISFEKDDEIDYFDRNFYHIYENSAKITAKLVEIILSQPLNDDVDLVSVNIPFEATLETPVQTTSIAREKYGQLFHGDGKTFKYSSQTASKEGFPSGTDIHALNNDEISITPISLDLTSEKSKQELNTLIQKSW
ncbi:MAG: 5'/3'-nucleotidase SurE [Candidatus Pacebacteria bacterium]|jgi:5'-nucleotidase|nr:5'/3'-nucleotidase SurE [Candidatus Paceibacterota bacterium]MBT3512329.1 5'/3'-nucleotidase SurE [Candidatus Paceibacterota bacterium]MBT4004689.1 5'/3'-nucleotidase SurE [Candidatus Paceibacterota bacterium]MBT4358392.1 5'/3'-nucleotidase SurE [Candidatus Paceibacterota bacterium]MBT4680827.1 5'/3'-nucleotidase SurE [Candidatus Paceibacterota bacterium]